MYIQPPAKVNAATTDTAAAEDPHHQSSYDLHSKESAEASTAILTAATEREANPLAWPDTSYTLFFYPFLFTSEDLRRRPCYLTVALVGTLWRDNDGDGGEATTRGTDLVGFASPWLTVPPAP